jgi:hypothetical protein
MPVVRRETTGEPVRFYLVQENVTQMALLVPTEQSSWAGPNLGGGRADGARIGPVEVPCRSALPCAGAPICWHIPFRVYRAALVCMADGLMTAHIHLPSNR